MKLPTAFTEKYQRLLGDEAPAFLASFQDEAVSGFRVNPKREHLPEDLDLSDPVAYCQWGFFGKVAGRTLAHQSGSVYSQEPSAMFVGEVSAPKQGQRVLDLCAAPGGKTTHLSSYLGSTGTLVTNEIMPKRAKVLSENVERFGVANALILNEDPDNIAKRFRGYFDTVLVDAPCSGEGMFRKDPEAMAYWSPDYVQTCAKRQQAILRSAVETIKVGGTLIYSTCTFSPEEDEQIIAWLLHTYPQLTLLPIEKPAGVGDGRPDWADGNPELEKAARLFPHRMRGEGHFVAKLLLASPLGTSRKVSAQRGNLTSEQTTLLNRFATQALTQSEWPKKRLLTFGDQLYLLPEGVPELRQLKVVRPGLHLGTFKKGRFEPSYALALALSQNEVRYNVTISVTEWGRLVQGAVLELEDLPIDRGWVRLVCEQQPVAFGKVVGTAVKNFFPKGLRFNPHLEK